MEFRSSSLAAAPLSRNNRIVFIDVLRGIAVLGILVVNIGGFGISTGGDFGNKLFTDKTSSNFFTYAAMYIFFEGKMRALFCMLFGAGILLFSMNKDTIDPKRVTRLLYLRLAWLIVFGLAHAHLLLWNGDVLFFYGLFGMIVFLLRKMKPGYMLMAIPLVTVIWFVMGTFFYRDMRDKRLAFNEADKVQQAGQQLTALQQQSIADWKEAEKTMLPDEAGAQASVERMRGTYEVVASEVRPKAFKAETTYLLVELGDNIALMLLGIALLKWGFLTGKWSSRQYRLTMLIGYVVALPVAVYELWYNAHYTSSAAAIIQQMEQNPVPWKSLLYPLQRIFMVMAHCAAIILLIKSGYLTALCKRLQAAGQMALTNYIVQTILCSFFFFGYGLGYYDQLEIYQLFYVVGVIWVLQLIYSPFWLKHFKFGPLEWLWRSLTYKQIKLNFPKWLIGKLSLVRIMNK
ncbi:DUF418 domain-containing protein [Lacibacter sediminis]|uniref:DUF418 domain-containing protein n=1 Tax=Lacibacter sediminis TaxID=2760713 RepID=A0A7G5XCG4_9BACT|nr:DUF418 domain-containing protein [Lacibacter sediminis]QNA43167.1 DUF418 domain-containing protein [Lacibacter sediminis]